MVGRSQHHQPKRERIPHERSFDKATTKVGSGKNRRGSLVVKFTFLSPRFLRIVSSINVLLCASSNAT